MAKQNRQQLLNSVIGLMSSLNRTARDQWMAIHDITHTSPPFKTTLIQIRIS